ncbi:MAG: phosphoribosylaminoimidazolesuccinocarboxamide synthase [Planctomycetota bacterium]
MSAQTAIEPAIVSTDLPLPGRRSGKVRDLYDLPTQPGETPRVLVVATDRVSAFDVVMPTPIPGKGRLLTRISLAWFRFLRSRGIVADHLLDERSGPVAGLTAAHHAALEGRSMVCRKVRIVPIECVVRGWLAGSGWAEYRETGRVCGVPLPAGLRPFDRLPEPIFTPAFKADAGHDENCTLEQAAERIGRPLAERLRELSLAIYAAAAQRAEGRGLVLADTKFEFGLRHGKLLLIDEALTPDSSRFWPAESWKPGSNPPSYDKQYLRDWLETLDWNKQYPPPTLTSAVIERTVEKYLEICRKVTGRVPVGAA